MAPDGWHKSRDIHPTWPLSCTDCALPAESWQTLSGGWRTHHDQSSSSCLPGPKLSDIHAWCGLTATCVPPD
eukprot:7276332-Prorocentrum_lima.AAC.1